MAVSKENTRISVTLTKEDYQLLKVLASKEKRSISNLLGKIISDYLENKKKE